MNTFHIGRVSAIAAATFVLAVGGIPWAADAAAPPTATGTVAVVHGLNCPLQRIGDQYVRCDDLTGAGRAAPEWVTVQAPHVVCRR